MVVWTSELFLLWDLSFAYGKGNATMRQLSIFFLVEGWEIFHEKSSETFTNYIKPAQTYNIL